MERPPVPSLPCVAQVTAPRRLSAALLAAVLALLAVVVAVLPSWRGASSGPAAQMSSAPLRDVAVADAASVLGRSRPEGYGGRSRPESYGASSRSPLSALGSGIGWDIAPDHLLPVFLALSVLAAGAGPVAPARHGHGAASGLFTRRVPTGPPAVGV